MEMTIKEYLESKIDQPRDKIGILNGGNVFLIREWIPVNNPKKRAIIKGFKFSLKHKIVETEKPLNQDEFIEFLNADQLIDWIDYFKEKLTEALLSDSKIVKPYPIKGGLKTGEITYSEEELKEIIESYEEAGF